MQRKTESKFTVFNTVLMLLCVTNVLELFLPRDETTNSFIRLPIQLIHLGIIGLMWRSILLKKRNWNQVTVNTALLVSIVVIYIIVFIFGDESVPLSAYSQYIRTIEWLSVLIYFYESLLRYSLNLFLMRWYIITYIISVLKQLLEASFFDREKLGGGDTASFPLLFLIPLILMCFYERWKSVAIGFACILIMISLRRTTIIGLALCLPFIFSYLKTKLKSYEVIGSIIVIIIAVGFAWSKFGDSLVTRFDEMFQGRDDGSYGSGRSDFYTLVWETWIKGNLSLLFGNGVFGVRKLLLAKFSIIHAHNDYLEIAYTFGLLGLTIWFGFIVSIWRTKALIKKYSPTNLNIFYINFISFIIITLASGCLLRVTTIPFSMVVAILLYEVRKGKRLKKEGEQQQLALKYNTAMQN
ncbi:O-antigen ligase family protein [Mucilaginibacter litoreus]|uniref:O-antigen ligase family protein n=1 Tax=Mucilaginibacter litoreus TaxID=1048221 RepID=A0ABW3AVX8_9SPHI